MKLRVEFVASASLGLLLTGCPLTDNYRLQEDAAGEVSGSGGPSGSEAGGADAVDAGGPSVSGSPNAGEPAISGAPNSAPGSGGAGGGYTDSSGRWRRGERQRQRHLRQRMR